MSKTDDGTSRGPFVVVKVAIIIVVLVVVVAVLGDDELRASLLARFRGEPAPEETPVEA